jgi:hypothetical protein
MIVYLTSLGDDTSEPAEDANVASFVISHLRSEAIGRLYLLVFFHHQHYYGSLS